MKNQEQQPLIKKDDNANQDDKKQKVSRDQGQAKKEKDNDQLDIEMKPGDYRVQIHILEAKDIVGKGKAGGGGLLAQFVEGENPDPMVEVEVMGQSKMTNYHSATNNPIFNELLFFEFNNLRLDDLETGMIKVSLMDHDFIGSNNLIGQFTVDVAYIYKMNKDHELYKMWVAISDITDETQGIKAFLKLSINVLGPGDKPPTHDPSKDLKGRNDNGALKLFTPGRVKMSAHVIKFGIYRAEHLAPLDLVQNNVDPYFKISFAGTKAESKTINDNRNPEFDQELSIACKIPCMNNKIKIEIWDDDLTYDKRVGTHYINFKDIMDKSIGPRWANLYGPQLTAEGEEADIMTKFGDKGSTYRGRFLYSVQTMNAENPKSGTKDLKFKFPGHPSPNVREIEYTLKIALYEGVELPEFDTVCIHVACGPYETTSKVVKNENSRAIWNQYMPELKIRAPETIEDIYDVIIYLAYDDKPGSRVCFKRLKAADILNTKGKKFEIENYLLEEDKSMDRLDDEQFPGIIYARVKLYAREIEDSFPANIFKSQETYVDYLLQLHLFMGRDFPPADETGAADPFIIARCQGKKARSRIKYETLNPGFFETLEMVVSLPPFNDKNYPKAGISLLIYDEDMGIFGEKKDLLGRVWIDLEKKTAQIESPVDHKMRTVIAHKDPEWFDLIFDATGAKEGQILVGYDIIPLHEREYVKLVIINQNFIYQFPVNKINIQPQTVPGVLSMALIGIRDIIPSINLLPVKKIYCKFDISGDTKEAVISNKHAVIGGSCNLFEVISLDIDVPTDLDYSPVLTVYAYDHVMGFLGSRLLGVANIPLEKYCKKVLKHLNSGTSAFMNKNLHKDKNKSPVKASDIKLMNKLKGYGSNRPDKLLPPNQTDLGTDEGHIKDPNSHLFENNINENPLRLSKPKSTVSIQRRLETEDHEELKQTQKELKKKKQIEDYKKQVEEEQKKEEEKKLQKLNESQERIQLIKQRSNASKKGAKKPKFMENLDDYDSQPDEKLDETPEWLVDRATVPDELEDTMGKPPFDVYKIKRGQTRGKVNFMAKTVQNTLETTGLFKNIIRIKDKSQQSSEVDQRFQEYITPKNLVARLYVLKGKSLTPKDTTTSDPYLVIKLGSTTISDKQSLRPKTCNPGFFTSYDISCSLPGASTLTIECWDDDGFDFPDLIGSTKIDLEDRYFNKEWRDLYPNKKPIEERTLFVPKSSAPQGVLQCWLELLDPKDAQSSPRYDIKPPPTEEYELRVIVWETRDCVFKDETTKCNDLFLTGIYGGKKLETDTHWRCRTKGSFNWRWKYNISLPLDLDEDYGKDVLQLQMWDRDIVDANDLIGEVQILLNDPDFRMLDKVYKRKSRVTMKKLDIKTKNTTDKFWVVFTNPEEKDKEGNYIPQGYAQISVEILPKHLADEVPNGLGRDGPNQHPILPEPTGRLQFDIFSPWKMFKELIGPELARKICCIFCCVACCILLIYWGFFFAGDIIGSLIALAGK